MGENSFNAAKSVEDVTCDRSPTSTAMAPCGSFMQRRHREVDPRILGEQRKVDVWSTCEADDHCTHPSMDEADT